VTLFQKPVILIDGSSYLYRAFHALPPLANSKGEPTGAIYGVISMIKKLLAEYTPVYTAVIFDPKGKTHRDHLYSEYKAHRPPMPLDLAAQINYLFEIIEALGLPIIVEEGIEADDVIGTLAAQATALRMPTLISTGDKDMAQLVSPSVTLINTMTNVLFDREAVINKFGVPPEKMVDYLALIGDKVDNIPGVPNVGPKTAMKWLAEYGSLEAIISRAEDIKGKVGDNLRQSLAILPLSKQLVTIHTDFALHYQVQDLIQKEPSKETLVELYKHLEFKAWLSELLDELVNHRHEVYPVITTEEELAKWLSRLEQKDIFSIDVEVSHANCLSSDLVGIAFALAPKESFYIPLAHDYDFAPSQLGIKPILQKIAPILQNPDKTLIGENLKFILNVLARYGIEVRNTLYDTMLESYAQNSAIAQHDKNTLALKLFGRKILNYEDIAGKGAKQLACNKLDVEKVAQYAAESADVILQLHHTMWQKIVKDSNLKAILVDIEMPLTRVLARMESAGVMIDSKMLQAHSKELSIRIQEIEEEAYQLAGCEFNLSSPKQLQAIFFEKLQLPVISKTPTGQPSTSEAILQELAHSYDLPRLILLHRSLIKLKSTYTDTLPLQINPQTGRVHTCYNQAVTATGRLSSTDPNLQNIPIRNEEGRRIRQAFIAPPGYKIVSADYSQIELRLMAHLSQDPGLLSAFEQNLDIHLATAAEVFNVPLEQVSHNQRRSAKAINFGLIYGMSSFGLSRQLGVDRDIAQKYIERYFERYPNIKTYMEQTRSLAHEQGYVETLYKRKIFLPEINAINLPRQKAAERAAINAPLQGTAAEIIKIAMINVDRWLQSSSIRSRMIMQVHDELVFEVHEDELNPALDNIKRCMTQTSNLNVPLVVDIGIGNNWDEAH
jgi:DNA polymerase I